ncbi:ABC transporter permease [Corynebacterium uberis]|uniref:FtsX-like permease family protein n=1 Tax=Corynebacterium uberis TaxID=2883169 RepID=UPI001D0A0732|nr:ABC transporter permease [Corynebacterium uberis]UDL80272.1 ABC transporter permease [Corynebacterium uberis]
MFLAVRDIRHATGRFALIASVIGLLTVLLVMLTGLTQGLGKQNTSALEALAPDAVVFSGTGKVDMGASRIDSPVSQRWADTAGVARATPVGIAQTRLEDAGGAHPVAVIGLPAGSMIPGTTTPVPQSGMVAPAELGVAAGTTVAAGGVDAPLVSVHDGDALYYSHLPVVWADLGTWRSVVHASAPTVLALTGDRDAFSEQWSATAQDTDTQAVSLTAALSGLPAYQSERGSLLSMQGLLYGISALVVIAFLSVWTIQRTRDIAVLRALGASTGYVLRDALAQAAIVLAAGAAAGTAIALGLGALAARGVPFEQSWMTTAVPALAVFGLGLAGAVVAVRRVSRVEPQLALS